MTDLSATNDVTDRRSGADIVGSVAPSKDHAHGDAITRISRFLDDHAPATPCLVMDLDTVRRRYRQLRSALPDARICYAVKANPLPEVVAALVDEGASFDVASPGEIELCLRQGAAPESLSYGNTIKKRSDIAFAHECGVRLFATDSAADLDVIAEAAPGATVFCRVLVDNEGSRTPFGRKFGCGVDQAAELLRTADALGLDPCGMSFHIGSQQHDPRAWEHGIRAAAEVFSAAAAAGVRLRMVNLGGGLPATYTEAPPELGDYIGRIEQVLDREFGADRPELLVEPGRFLVGDAGVLSSEVIRVTPEEHGSRRWVYLDIGRYGGLAETEGEAITYRLRTSRDGDPTGPVVLAGPTCDGDDVLYERSAYALPGTLRAGDRVQLLSAGAYTASYSSVGFNGFAPLATHCLDGERTERP